MEPCVFYCFVSSINLWSLIVGLPCWRLLCSIAFGSLLFESVSCGRVYSCIYGYIFTVVLAWVFGFCLVFFES